MKKQLAVEFIFLLTCIVLSPITFGVNFNIINESQIKYKYKAQGISDNINVNQEVKILAK